MVRVKRGNVALNRRKQILSLASGYCGAHSILFRIANQQIMKALKYSYIDKKKKKRNFRKIWIMRINGAARLIGLSYSRLIYSFKKSNVNLNRKMIAQLSILDNSTFKVLMNFKK